MSQGNYMVRPCPAVYPYGHPKYCFALFCTVDCTVRRVELEYGYEELLEIALDRLQQSTHSLPKSIVLHCRLHCSQSGV
jgi:hypothetical protein